MAGTERRTGKPERRQLTKQSFWENALRLYNNPGIKAHCLAMQDQHGLNVNLLLLMMWLEEEQRPLTLTQFEALRSDINQFNQEFTAPLRQQRRYLSQAHQLSEKSRQQLKEKLLAAELVLEAEEQALLLETYLRLPDDASHPVFSYSLESHWR